jgi:nitrilase
MTRTVNRVTVLQMSPGQDKRANIADAERLIAAAVAADRPDFISLPEVWSCLGGSRETKLSQAELLPPVGAGAGDAAYEALRNAALRHRVVIHGGSIIERVGDRMFNTTVAFGPDGAELARYRKLHLFDIVTPDGTGYRESDSFGRGDEVVGYLAGGLPVGCTICYDLRFFELFLALRERGAELIVTPSAFTVPTGRDHWETLLRARAIDTQCWIAAPATVGAHKDAVGGTRMTWGHAMICNPWGDVVAEVGEGVGWATAEIDHAMTQRLRRDMPVMAHRRFPTITSPVGDV